MNPWNCVRICVGIVPVPAAVLAGYIALHPLPGCDTHCHYVIPPEAFRPGGELYRAPPGGLIPPAGYGYAPFTPQGSYPPGYASYPRPAYDVGPAPAADALPPVPTPVPTPLLATLPPVVALAPPTPTDVPEPASALLFAAALGVLVLIRR